MIEFTQLLQTNKRNKLNASDAYYKETRETLFSGKINL